MLSFCLLALCKQSRAAPNLRPDLKQGLSEILCSSSHIPKLEKFWQKNIYDLHIQTHIIDSREIEDLSQSKLQQIAKKFAEKLGMESFASNICPQISGHRNRAWIAVLPSKKLSIEKKDEQIKLEITTLQKSCRSYRIDYAPLQLSKSKALMVSTKTDSKRFLNINTKFLKPGTIGITCYPKYDNNSAPIEWAIIPVHQSISKNKYLQLISRIKTERHFKQWINLIRKSLGLSPLNFNNQQITSQMGQLAKQNNTAFHNRSQLHSLKAKLNEKSFRFKGENRALGKSLSEAAWLFWHSPRHRSLLLHPTANFAGLEVMTRSQKTLAVLILAQRQISKKINHSSKRRRL